MFAWLSHLVDDARIALAYSAYERECRAQWVKQAEGAYSTAPLVREIRARMAAPLQHCAITYEIPIRALEDRREQVHRVLIDAEEKLATLCRDYRTHAPGVYGRYVAALRRMRACPAFRRMPDATPDASRYPRGASTMMVEPCSNQPSSSPRRTAVLQGISFGPR